MSKFSKMSSISFYLLIIAVFILSSCSGDSFKRIDNPNSKEYSKLKADQDDKEMIKIKENKVKERRIYSKFTKNVVKSGGREVLAETIRFDENGNKTEQFRYSSSGVNVQWLYDYDEYGNLRTIEEYDGFRNLIKKTIFNHKSNGLLLEKIEEMKNYKIYYEYTYDDSSNLMNINLLNTDKVLYSKFNYKYTSDILDTINNYRNNTLSAQFLFDYDSLNRRTREKIVNSANQARIIEYEYDDKGNLIFINNRKLTKNSYTFDSAGNITEEKILSAAGEFQSRTTFSYNESNNLLSSKTRFDGLNRPSLEIRCEYDFY